MFRQLELTKENKRLLIKFAVSLLVTVLLTVMLCTLSAFAEQGTADSGAAQALSTAEAQQSATGEAQHNPGDYLDTDPTYVNKDAGSSVIQELIGVDASQPLEIIILLTLIVRISVTAAALSANCCPGSECSVLVSESSWKRIVPHAVFMLFPSS